MYLTWQGGFMKTKQEKIIEIRKLIRELEEFAIDSINDDCGDGVEGYEFLKDAIDVLIDLKEE